MLTASFRVLSSGCMSLDVVSPFESGVEMIVEKVEHPSAAGPCIWQL